MTSLIDKPVGLVVSGGRTGTSFFAEKLPILIPGSIGFHEPETIHKGRVMSDAAFVLREFGFYHGVIGKLRNTRGVRSLSHKAITGQFSRSQLIEHFDYQRREFYEGKAANLVIEANYGFYGVLDILPNIFANYRVAAVIRDPATWIDSYLKRNTAQYGRNDWISRLGLRITPADIGDNATAELWPNLAVAEKLAWFWNLLYGCIEAASDTDKDIRIFRFEDLFLSSNREEYIRQLATFMAGASALSPITTFPPDLFGKRINASRANAHEKASEEARAAADAWCSERRGRWYPSNAVRRDSASTT